MSNKKFFTHEVFWRPSWESPE